MTIEFWPRRCRTPKPAPKPKKKPKPCRPKLPLRAGKAHQLLTSAIICGDHELASWIDAAAKASQISGDPDHIRELWDRLDAVMAPL